MRQVRGWKRSDKVRQAAMECLEGRRLCHAGDLDPSFSGDGTATITPGGTFVVSSMDTRGGRTVVVGGTGESSPGVVTGPANIVAYNNSGNIDTTFSGDGIRPMPRLINATDIFIQPDGKILVVGQVDGVPGVARMLKNGGADTSFSGDGFMTVPQMKTLTGVRLTSTGKIVLSGVANTNGFDHLAAARLNVNGSMDTGFSGDGFVNLNIDGHANAVEVQSDDKIVLVGDTPSTETGEDIVVARLTTAGALDTSFGGGDGWTTYVDAGGSVGTSVDLTPAGRILVGAVFSGNVIGALRLTKAGGFDAVVADFGQLEGSYAVVNNIRSSFDGNQFYLFADRYNDGIFGSIVARYDSDFTPDHTFGNNGRIDSGGEGHGDLQADSKVVTAGNPTQASSGGIVTNTARVQARRRNVAIDNNDRIQLRGNVIIVEGTTGNDKITVTRDTPTSPLIVKLNTMSRTFSAASITETRIEGGKGDDIIDITFSHIVGALFGGEGRDTIHGDDKNDRIYAGEGHDNVVADKGNDLVFGNSGEDNLNGGVGNDELYGGGDRDQLYGGSGDDTLCGADRQIIVDHVPDYLDGQTGTDTALFVEDVDVLNHIELRG